MWRNQYCIQICESTSCIYYYRGLGTYEQKACPKIVIHPRVIVLLTHQDMEIANYLVIWRKEIEFKTHDGIPDYTYFQK